IVVLVEGDAPIERSRLVELAEHGPAVGVHVVWVATTVAALPAACAMYVAVDAASDGATVGDVHDGNEVVPVQIEPIDPATCEHFARLTAPLVDAGARVDDATDIPRSVALLTLLD